MIGAFYGLGKDLFAKTEYLWEGIFGILASMIITAMGAALLRVSKLQDKWRVKIGKAIESKDQPGTKFSHRFRHFAEKYAMFWLPFITVLREGLEAVIFIGIHSSLSPVTLCTYLKPRWRGTELSSQRISPPRCLRSACRRCHRLPHLSRRKPLCPADLSHHLHLLPVSCRCRSLLQGCLVLGGS